MQLRIVVRALSPTERLASTGAVCSLLVTGAGVIAFSGGSGIVAASLLLSIAALTGAIGAGYARDRELGWGLALLVAAALPLFYALYAAGVAIFERFGPGVAGGLLVSFGMSIAVGTALLWLKDARRRTGGISA